MRESRVSETGGLERAGAGLSAWKRTEEEREGERERKRGAFLSARGVVIGGRGIRRSREGRDGVSVPPLRGTSGGYRTITASFPAIVP